MRATTRVATQLRAAAACGCPTNPGHWVCRRWRAHERSTAPHRRRRLVQWLPGPASSAVCWLATLWPRAWASRLAIIGASGAAHRHPECGGRRRGAGCGRSLARPAYAARASVVGGPRLPTPATLIAGVRSSAWHASSDSSIVLNSVERCHTTGSLCAKDGRALCVAARITHVVIGPRTVLHGRHAPRSTRCAVATSDERVSSAWQTAVTQSRTRVTQCVCCTSS